MSFTDRTLNDLQFKNMTYRDMMSAIYFTQRINWETHNKKKKRNVAHQLLRILIRVCNFNKIDFSELYDEVVFDENKQYEESLEGGCSPR